MVRGDKNNHLSKKTINLFLNNLSIPNKNLKSFINKYKNYKSNNILFFDKNYLITKSFCDVHVHFREPGYSYKETIKTGSLAAAHGGYTSVCTMPNLDPAPFNLVNLNKQLKIIKKDAVIEVIPFGRISKDNNKQLAELEKTAKYVVGYSDDGKGVEDKNLMLKAMKKAKKLNKVISAHCEDTSLIKKGGCIHEGEYAKKHHLIGISSSSEYKQVERDLSLASKSKVKYHVCHVSTKESVELIRKAKKKGVNVTCETAPHYLCLNENDLKDDGRYKINPPIRGKSDQLALIKGIKDGTIDIIATDHAPHSKVEKSKGLKNSSFGAVGLETSFPVLYTRLVKDKIITLDKLIQLITDNPRHRFNIKDNGFTIFDLSNKYKIDSKDFYSKGKSTPFDKQLVYGKCVLTVYNNKIVYKDKKYIK